MNLSVGDIVELKVSCLGNLPKVKGVVFSTYEDFDDPHKFGAQIIFENGGYDGFSAYDQEFFLKRLEKANPEFCNYIFENVNKVSNDFENGYWDKILKN